MVAEAFCTSLEDPALPSASFLSEFLLLLAVLLFFFVFLFLVFEFTPDMCFP